jgi:hypothetical protein
MEWAKGAGGRKVTVLGFSRAAAALLAAAAAGACRAPAPAVAPGPAEPSEPIEALASRAEPTWVGQPLSWEKLDALELWLVEAAQEHDSALELEGRLQLSEGRLEFARRDIAAASGRNQDALGRVELARCGFEQVLADPRASKGQHARAQYGLESARSVQGKQPAASNVAILPRSSWKAQAARTREMTAVRGTWSRITVHHSAETQDENRGGSLQDTAATLRRIQKVHMDAGDPEHGWADIGYHFLIDGSGRVLEGRELAWQGAHARGANNRDNIGVCLLGDFSRRSPSQAALASLQRVLDDLRKRYSVPGSRVYLHKELTSTDCPGPSLSAWVVRYRKGARGGAEQGRLAALEAR